MRKEYLMHHLKISLLATFALFLALLVVACGTTTTAAQAVSSDEPVALSLPSRDFAFNGSVQPTLILRGDVCRVLVEGRNVARMSVHVTVHHYRANQMPSITYASNVSKTMLTIEEKLPPRANTNGSNDSVDFTITVPQHSNVSLSTKVGNIAVNNVIGQMTLVANSGSITTSHVQLSGQSSLSTNVGSIAFFGALTRNGRYSMDTRVGTITATLPADTSLQVAAQTSIGVISSNFASMQSLGASTQGTIGKAPYAHLSLTTHIGSIFLQQA